MERKSETGVHIGEYRLEGVRTVERGACTEDRFSARKRRGDEEVSRDSAQGREAETDSPKRHALVE
jgi:hypothetical protein